MVVVRRIVSRLRSRRLAIWLLVGTLTYTGLLTVLKIPNPYSNPVFIGVACLLTASTAACSWERSAAAVRAIRRAGSGAQTTAGGGVGAPSLRISLPAALDRDAAADALQAALRESRLHCTERDGVFTGRSHTASHLGSPIFHWALTALFLLGALGQLMRAEGWTTIAIGDSVLDAAQSYPQKGIVGPLFMRRYTGVDIGVDEITYGYTVDGTDRGPSPLVSISRDGTEISRTRVYPNSPATYGPLTIHRDKVGPALIAQVRPAGGKEATTVPVYFAPVVGTATPDPVSIDVAYGTARPYSVEFAPQTDRRIVVKVVGTDFASMPLAKGDSTVLPDGTEVTLANLTSYVRLFVVNDWTVPFIYLAFALIAVVPLWSLLWPPRLVLAAFSDENTSLDVRVIQAKSDPAFRLMVKTALEKSFHL